MVRVAIQTAADELQTEEVLDVQPSSQDRSLSLLCADRSAPREVIQTVTNDSQAEDMARVAIQTAADELQTEEVLDVQPSSQESSQPCIRTAAGNSQVEELLSEAIE